MSSDTRLDHSRLGFRRAGEHPVTLSHAIELPKGSVLQGGRYVVGPVLGRGGFGITYATEDRRLQRLVAIKELFPDGASRSSGSVLAPPRSEDAFAAARSRFLREAAVLARFSHPSIVRVYEVFEERNTAYLVMELLEGRTLLAFLDERGGPLGEREAMDVVLRGGQALAEIHAAGILHRDVNPANVMLAKSGRLVLIDFGLAQNFRAERTGVMTRMVTPGYAPPEQYLGEARFGPPTDVYGLAATAYRVLTGRPPVSALDRQAGALLPPPHRVNAAVSRSVSDAVLDGLELNAGHRPQSMEAFANRLGLSLDDAGVPPARTVAMGPRTSAAPPPAPSGAVPSAPPLAPSPAAPPAPAAAGAGSAARSATAGDEERGRSPWKVGVPLLGVVAALGAAAPALWPVVLALVVLPAIATVGDGMTYVRVRRADGRMRWFHRAALGGVVPARFGRNVGAVLYSGAPALVLSGAVVATALLLDAVDASARTQELVLRPGGVAAALLLAVPVARNRARFRIGVVTDEVTERCLEEDDRITRHGMILWAVAVLLIAVGFGFHPELWPLH